MKPFFEEQFGNPSNTYTLGQTAKEAVSMARRQVANLIGADDNEVYFTGCGSESNNTVLKGVAFGKREHGKHIITSNIEHPSIVEPLTFLKHFGYEVTYIPVDVSGAVSANDVEKAIRPDTILVTIMHSNNEVGTLQPIAEIGKFCRQKGILFHTDASQSIGKVAVNVTDLQVDFLTIAGHKLYAPKGIGALYIRKGIILEPLLHGAKQEGGIRAGTENVPYIAGLGKAAEIAQAYLANQDILEKKQYFYIALPL
jgi:Cysteine sulfinate desulfinase/cysteine desulfurase and related enzymes